MQAIKLNRFNKQDLKQLIIPLLLGKQLNSKDSETNLIQDFCQNLEILDCELGDLLLTFSPNTENLYREDNTSKYLYLIAQGSVRILAFDADKQREVCTQVFNKGDTFGGDNLFCQGCSNYRAIAAEEGQIARIELTKLSSWLTKIPSLQQQWQLAAKQRQKAIFCKTSTEFRTLSSQKLQQLLGYIQEKTLPTGTKLAQLPGRFWLYTGKIQGENLHPGSSWGYPEKIPNNWQSETDLLVYHLAPEDWENAKEIAPILERSNSNTSGSATAKSAPIIIRPKTEVVALPPPPPPLDTDSFPKPQKYRGSPWRGYPFIAQQSSSDCGAACLAMVSQYWGKEISINWLRQLIGVGRAGASLKKIGRAAETLGYQTMPVRANLNSMLDEKYPWIAHWQGSHYVVVYRIKGNRVLVADPAVGKKAFSKKEFSDNWTGYALTLEPTDNLNAAPKEKKSLSRFIRLLSPYQGLGIQIIFVSLLIQLFGLITPLFTQIILDRIVVNKSLSTLNVFAFGVLFFGLWGIGLTAMREYLLSYLSNRLDLTMLSGFIRHALMLPLKFFEDRDVGDIITRVQENQKIQRFLLSKVVLAWLDFLMGFVYLGLMLYYNWQLTLLVVAIIPPILLLTLISTPWLKKISREVFSRSAEQNSALVETISGVATIKSTASEREFRWRWEDRLTKFLTARFNSQKLGIKLQTISSAINNLGSTALLWYGAMLVIGGTLTIGQFVAFNMLIGKVVSPILSLANLWDELQEVLVSVEKLNDVFATTPEEIPTNPLLILPPVQGAIRFDNVTFRYDVDEEQNILQNVSFSVNPGDTIAIVGRSGSGKSTLIKLLQGLYHTTKGTIWVDEHDLRHVSPVSWRSQLGVVPQDCQLFSGTILENITLYRADYTLEQVVSSAKLAEAHSFISAMPLGYNTKVGERGMNLSGGQRQRIAIARALLGEPRVLILDEATSSLDTESERRFQENLERLSQNCTTFIIAHRLSTVQNADCIIILDRGAIVQKGNHQELIQQKHGLYYHLAQQQLSL